MKAPKILKNYSLIAPTRRTKETKYGPRKGSTPPGIHNNTKGA